MGEIKQEGAITVHDDAGMAAVHAVIGALAGHVEQEVGLTGPVELVVRAIDAQALPRIDEHPGMAFPIEHERAFATTRHAGTATTVSPGVEVGAVGKPD